MAAKFKSGDLVILKSGSPVMTVNKYNDSSSIECMYYNTTENKFLLIDIQENALQLKSDTDKTAAE